MYVIKEYFPFIMIAVFLGLAVMGFKGNSGGGKNGGNSGGNNGGQSGQ